MLSTIAPKNAEFAYLFDLFETLATRRARAAVAGDIVEMDDTHTLSIPTDLQPVFRNLATLITPRTTSGTATRRSRRNTVAVPSSSSGDIDTDSDSDSNSVAKFPLGKQYPFKFRMMLHKLYELEDWGRKVKDILERSKKEFKPLSEKENVCVSEDRTKETWMEEGETGRVHFGGDFGVGSPRRTGRPRSHTMVSSGNKGGKDLRGGAGLMARTVEPRDDERAVKKRCVGRRKSTNGMDDKAAWVYDSAVASSEINERCSSLDAPAPVPIVRYGALQQDVRQRGPSRRRVSSLASVAPAAANRSEGMDTERKAKKRRSTSMAIVKGP